MMQNVNTRTETNKRSKKNTDPTSSTAELSSSTTFSSTTSPSTRSPHYSTSSSFTMQTSSTSEASSSRQFIQQPHQTRQRKLPTQQPPLTIQTIQSKNLERKNQSRTCSCVCAVKGCMNKYKKGGGLKFSRIKPPVDGIIQEPNHDMDRWGAIKSYY